MIAPFLIVPLTGTLPTDIAYARRAETMWATFSGSILAVGMAIGVPAALAGLVDFIGNQRERAQRPELVARAIPPDYALGSHVAPLVLVFSGNGGWRPAGAL